MNTKPLKYDKLIAVKLTTAQHKIVDEYVKSGKHPRIKSASELIREAIDCYLLDNKYHFGFDEVDNYFEGCHSN